MLAMVLAEAGLDPSFVVGGDLHEVGTGAHWSGGPWLVVEADESDGTHLELPLAGTILTNVEADHLDHYADLDAVADAFVRFARTLDHDGFLVACLDDPGSAALARQVSGNGRAVWTYGESEVADVRVDGLRLDGTGSTFDVVVRGRPLGPVRLQVPGRYNALNAAAALSAGLALGVPDAALREGLAGFTGTRRRFDLKGVSGGVRVYDDYAHHPTEVAAVLRAARDVAGLGRVVVAFQPHRYSRTAAFRQQFGAALGLADDVVVMEVYPAGEDPVPGASGAGVAAAVPLPSEHVVFEPSWSAVAGRLAERAGPGDLVLTVGAGDVTMVGPEVLALLDVRDVS
jgi:UDP-N-acetylmuramate--alanine ligase